MSSSLRITDDLRVMSRIPFPSKEELFGAIWGKSVTIYQLSESDGCALVSSVSHATIKNAQRVHMCIKTYETCDSVKIRA